MPCKGTPSDETAIGSRLLVVSQGALREVLGGQCSGGREGRTDRDPAPEGVGGDRGGLSGVRDGGHPLVETIVGEGCDRPGAVADRYQPIGCVPGVGAGAIVCELAILVF